MSANATDLPSALQWIHDMAPRRAARSLAVFLDYDGTLTPIAARPELARISPTMLHTVEALATLCPVAIVSGRDLNDVRSLMGLPQLIYAGSHGFEIKGPDGLAHREGEAFAAQIDSAATALHHALANVEGALIERKTCSVAVHYRLVSSDKIGRIEQAAEAVLSGHPQLRRCRGKRVIELQPAIDWHKGKAVLWLLDALSARLGPLFPLYLGDDLTDEDAFACLSAAGVGIIVGQKPRKTAAQLQLRDVEEVHQFLQALARSIKEHSAAAPDA